MESSDIVLYGYYRSSSSWRLRTILNLKDINYIRKPVNLVTAEHSKEAFKSLNPTGSVPCISVGETIMVESMAISEYLEEKYTGSLFI